MKVKTYLTAILENEYSDFSRRAKARKSARAKIGISGLSRKKAMQTPALRDVMKRSKSLVKDTLRGGLLPGETWGGKDGATPSSYDATPKRTQQSVKKSIARNRGKALSNMDRSKAAKKGWETRKRGGGGSSSGSKSSHMSVL